MEVAAAVVTIIAGAIALLAWFTGKQTFKDFLSKTWRGWALSSLRSSTSHQKASAGVTDITTSPIRLLFEFASTGQVLEISVVPNLSVGELKRGVMRELSLSDRFTDGRIAETQVVSKTRGGIALDESKTLEENGVNDGELLYILFSQRAG